MLAPGDIERIAGYFDTEVTSDFISKNFRAAEGVRTAQDGDALMLPIILPAQKVNGECVFYANGKCTIHAVAPFGCSQSNPFGDTPAGSAVACESLNALIKREENLSGYFLTWYHLFQRGLKNAAREW